MGWGYCGKNSLTGEEMGYSVEGICHHPDCDEKINHGLAYVCGAMHEDENTCQHYFCTKHLTWGEVNGELVQMCEKCAKEWDVYNYLECTECGKRPAEIGILDFDHKVGDPCPCDDCVEEGCTGILYDNRK